MIRLVRILTLAICAGAISLSSPLSTLSVHATEGGNFELPTKPRTTIPRKKRAKKPQLRRSKTKKSSPTEAKRRPRFFAPAPRTRRYKSQIGSQARVKEVIADDASVRRRHRILSARLRRAEDALDAARAHRQQTHDNYRKAKAVKAVTAKAAKRNPNSKTAARADKTAEKTLKIAERWQDRAIRKEFHARDKYVAQQKKLQRYEYEISGARLRDFTRSLRTF